jgi:uroporphyrinogen-III synthase
VIPQIVPPLTGLSVLVTRPAAQAQSLIDSMRALGAEVIALPTIEILPVAAAAVIATYDTVVFTSVNAVHHGAPQVATLAQSRIVAIGPATAEALRAVKHAPHLVPPDANSESLLEHSELNLAPGQRVLIVRGQGGRELLRETLLSRNIHVDVLDVYQRVLPTYPREIIEALEKRWADDGIHAVVATSVDTLVNLAALLSTEGRSLLNETPVVVPSVRVRTAAMTASIGGEYLLAPGAGDAALLGTLCRWHARARTKAPA